MLARIRRRETGRQARNSADRSARSGDVDRARREWTELWREGSRHPALAARLAWEDRAEWSAWLNRNGTFVITSELVFAAFFAFGLVFRAYNPALNYTEKPMDLLFLNSMLHSPDFPPNDPWLSGFAVSY